MHSRWRGYQLLTLGYFNNLFQVDLVQIQPVCPSLSQGTDLEMLSPDPQLLFFHSAEAWKSACIEIQQRKDQIIVSHLWLKLEANSQNCLQTLSTVVQI